MLKEISFSPRNATGAWYRILLSLVFVWAAFLAGVFFELGNVVFMSTLFFLIVGILAYVFLDAILFLIMHGDNRPEQHKLVIVSSVFCLLFNLVLFYGFFYLFSSKAL